MALFTASKSFLMLYFCYTLSCVGDRLWTFAIVFVMQKLGKMRLVGINQLFESLSLMFTASYVGNWLDRHSRKTGTLTIISLNNLSILFSASLLIICLTMNGFSSYLYTLFLALSIFFCALSSCMTEGQRLAFTKDWIVVMTQAENDKSTLSQENAKMTIIDHLSSVFASLATGLMFEFCSYPVACSIIICWNLSSWILERWLICQIYDNVQELSVRKAPTDEDDSTKAEIESLTGKTRSNSLTNVISFIRAYLRQAVFPAAFALALLYMTVLGFDGLAISHGESQGLSEGLIGSLRSISLALGILGAFTYTFAEQKIGVRKTGLMGFIFQLSFLWLCVLSIFLHGSPFDPIGYINDWTFENWLKTFKSSIYFEESERTTSNSTDILTDLLFNSTDVMTNSTIIPKITWSTLHLSKEKPGIMVFFFGLTMSRFGLWIVDLSITQIMQESIAEEERNTIFGVQNAFSQFFSVLKDILVILIADQRMFGIWITVSVMFVTSGLLQYCYYLVKVKRMKRRRNVSLSKKPDESQEMEKLGPNNS